MSLRHIAHRFSPIAKVTGRSAPTNTALHNGRTKHRESMPDFLDGVFAINKPAGMSSYQVIRDCQACFKPSALFHETLQAEERKRQEQTHGGSKQRGRKRQLALNPKMGHGGTLDPLASGLVVLGVGSGTKSLGRFLGDSTKEYETVIVFGAASDSQDRVGRVYRTAPYAHVTRDLVAAALSDFHGDVRQTPPSFSAIKMEGRPLYEYARERIPLPRAIPTRTVRVYQIELLEWYEPGTHCHYWPDAMASEEEKEVALRLEEAASASTRCGDGDEHCESESKAATLVTTGAADGASLSTAGAKRKEPVSATVEDGDEDSNGGGDSDLPNKRIRPMVVETSLPTATIAPSASIPVPAAAAHVTQKQKRKQNQKPKREWNEKDDQSGHNLLPPPPTQAPWHPDAGPPAVRIRLRVGSGFYVRTFAHDLGRKLGSAALMAELERTVQGMFRLRSKDVVPYELIAPREASWYRERVPTAGAGAGAAPATATATATATAEGAVETVTEAKDTNKDDGMVDSNKPSSLIPSLSSSSEDQWAPVVASLLEKWRVYERKASQLQGPTDNNTSTPQSARSGDHGESELEQFTREFWDGQGWTLNAEMNAKLERCLREHRERNVPR